MKENNDKFKIQENNEDKQKNDFTEIDSKDVEIMEQKYEHEIPKIKELMAKKEYYQKQIEQYDQKILEFEQKVIQENEEDKQKNKNDFAEIDSKDVKIVLNEIENNNMDNSYGNTSNTIKEIVDNLSGANSSERELKNKQIYDVSLTLETNKKTKTNCFKKICNVLKKIFCCCFYRDKKNQTNDINNLNQINKVANQNIVNNQ